MKNGDFPVRYVKLPEGRWWWTMINPWLNIDIHIVIFFLDTHIHSDENCSVHYVNMNINHYDHYDININMV